MKQSEKNLLFVGSLPKFPHSKAKSKDPELHPRVPHMWQVPEPSSAASQDAHQQEVCSEAGELSQTWHFNI